MSGRKSNLLRFQTITNGNMGAVSVTSTVTNIEFMDNIGLQLVWAGTAPLGVAEVQVSLDYAQDYQGNVTNTGTWVALSFASPLSVAGNTGSIYCDVNQISAPWIRVVYTKTSGVGTLQGYIAGKTI